MIAWLFEVSNRTLGVNPAFLKTESTISRMVEVFCVRTKDSSLSRARSPFFISKAVTSFVGTARTISSEASVS